MTDAASSTPTREDERLLAETKQAEGVDSVHSLGFNLPRDRSIFPEVKTLFAGQPGTGHKEARRDAIKRMLYPKHHSSAQPDKGSFRQQCQRVNTYLRVRCSWRTPIGRNCGVRLYPQTQRHIGCLTNTHPRTGDYSFCGLQTTTF